MSSQSSRGLDAIPPCQFSALGGTLPPVMTSEVADTIEALERRSASMDDRQTPGRYGEVGLMVVRNDRGMDKRWYVVTGTAQYPDYAKPGAAGAEYIGGHYLTPDDADELAGHLKRCADWARAQQILEPKEVSDAA